MPILIGGTPALRHDWFVFDDRASFFASAWNTFGGWVADGIGTPRPYPTDYILIAANSLLVFILGPKLDLVCVLFLIGFACARAGFLIAERFKAPTAACISMALFFTFNPWVYSKVVAGHIFMVLAYAAIAMLILELSGYETNERYASLLLVLTLQQLQFFLIAFTMVFIWSLLRRRFIALATGLVIAAPIIVGILTNQSTLLATPYNLAWQTGQSVDPVKALTLQGYFTKYAAGIPSLSVASVWGFFALALAGAFFSVRKLMGRITVAAALLVWLTVAGTKGYVAPLYTYVVIHITQSGVFRELYDLIGYLALCYALLASAALAKLRWLQWPALAFGCLIAGAWFWDRPSQFWVSLERLPKADVTAPPNSRFALLPAFQPLQFEGRGSGLDPGAFARPSNVTPVNTQQFTYPSDAALSRYALSGDARMLAALSVSDVVARRWLSTDRGSLKSQTPLGLRTPNPSGAQSLTIPYFRPELTVEPIPQVAGFISDLGADQVWFSDVAGLRGEGVPRSWASFHQVTSVTPSNAAFNPSVAWVDVRQTFAFQPELGEAIGGALTTSRIAQLKVKAGEQALVFVRGKLLTSSGEFLTGTTNGYKWIDVPPEATAVTCDGECVVAAQGTPPRLPATSLTERRSLRSVSFHALAPWLALATLPPSDGALLRYNVRFNTCWIAIYKGRSIPHLKVATLFNGWIVPQHREYRSVILVEIVALGQFVLEVCGLVWALWLLFSTLNPIAGRAKLWETLGNGARR